MDTETGLYCIYTDGRTRYYDPVLMMYLDAETPENVFGNLNIINGLDRNAITVDNNINLIPNHDNIYTSSELYPDPFYDPDAEKSWWEINWKKAVQWISFCIMVAVTILLLIIPGTQAHGMGMLMAGIKFAISGAVIGGLIVGYINSKNGYSFWDGFVEGAICGAINGYTTGALLYGIANFKDIVASANRALSKGVYVLDPKIKSDIYQFESRAKLLEHFDRHNSQFRGLYETADDYLAGANNVIKNGTYNSTLNGYQMYYRITSKGKDLYHFVGMTRDGAYITTYHPKIF